MKDQMKMVATGLIGMIFGMTLISAPMVVLIKYRPEAIPVLLGKPVIKVNVTVTCPCTPKRGIGGHVGAMPDTSTKQ